MGDSQYDEENQSQATLAAANLSQARSLIPPNIRATRDQVFHITQDVTWVLNSTRPIEDGKQTLN